MLIAETCTWKLGPFTVQQRPRFDNPAFAVYIVMRGDKLIGRSFSIPDLGCCKWLELQTMDRVVYAPANKHKYGRVYSINTNGRARNATRK